MKSAVWIFEMKSINKDKDGTHSILLIPNAALEAEKQVAEGSCSCCLSLALAFLLLKHSNRGSAKEMCVELANRMIIWFSFLHGNSFYLSSQWFYLVFSHRGPNFFFSSLYCVQVNSASVILWKLIRLIRNSMQFF